MTMRSPPLASAAESFSVRMSGAYAWDYDCVDDRARHLYDLGKGLNWDADKDVDWGAGFYWFAGHGLSAEQEARILAWTATASPWLEFPPYRDMSATARHAFHRREHLWHICQFLHGEQGALLVASQLCACVPDLNAKLFAASQAYDEARHVEFFSKYLDRAGAAPYPIAPGLKTLLGSIMHSAHWDFKLIGMQVVIEGLALAAFRSALQESPDPVLKQGLKLILRDESRHTNFGLYYLQDFLASLDAGALAARQDFALRACALARDLMVPHAVFEECGWAPRMVDAFVARQRIYAKFQKELFATIIPQLSCLNLIPERLRGRYRALGADDP